MITDHTSPLPGLYHRSGWKKQPNCSSVSHSNHSDESLPYTKTSSIAHYKRSIEQKKSTAISAVNIAKAEKVSEALRLIATNPRKGEVAA